MRILARLGVLIVLAMTPTWALARPPVWVVRDHDSTVVLFGSVHLLPQGLEWRPPALLTALAQADDVWFEAPMDAAGLDAAMHEAQARATLPQGASLRKLLSPKGRERLIQAASKLKVTPEQLDRLQPWYVDLAVSENVYESVGAKGSQGVEQQMWAQIPAAVPHRAFETPSEQVGFFADFPMKDQVASLEETLSQMNEGEKDYHVLLEAWMAGDLRTLDKEVVRPLRKASPVIYDVLVRRRNTRWTAAIADRLKGSGHTVVIVGMGHLIGPDGLPARLRALGYEVEGPL